MAKKWERSEAVVAQRLSAYQIGGMFSKKIHVMKDEVALLEEGGEAVKRFEHGKHKVAGMFSARDRNVVFVDKSPKTIRRHVQDLWTREDKKIIAAIEMRLGVSDPDKLRTFIMKRRDVVTLEDLWLELEKEVVAGALSPVIKKKGIDDLQGDKKTIKEIQVAAEVWLRKKLELVGLDLLSFSVEFILPDDYEEYLKKRGMMREETEKKAVALELDTEQAIHDREIGEIKGTLEDREQALAELERERIKREAEMGIEEEETQEDMRDALEALKLKEIKDKQKILRDSERERLGLATLQESSPAEDRDKLEKRYKELHKMMDATEKKYYKRKIGEEAFKDMMEKYEQQKTELEVQMKEKKKPGKGEDERKHD